MVQVITREWEITKTYIYDIVLRDGIIQLDWDDFQMFANHHRPMAAVRVEENRTVPQLVEQATEEVMNCTSKKLSCFIISIYHKDGEDIMMDELMGVAKQMRTIVDDDVQIKCCVSHKNNMETPRGICIYAFE